MTESRKPTAPFERLEFIDALRGFALFGVFWANLLIFAGVTYMTDEQRSALLTGALDRGAYLLERFLVENKFMGLFSFLFGISFWLFISRARARGAEGTGLFYRRIGWLLAIGLVHGTLLWWGDVLRFYALWAVLLPFFANTPPRRLLAVALGSGVLVPALISAARSWVQTGAEPAIDFDALVLATFARGSYAEVWSANLRYDGHLTFSIGSLAYQVAVFGRLLLGLYVARTFDFGNLAVHRALLGKILIAGGLAGAVGSAVFTAELLTHATGSAVLSFLGRLVVEGGQLGLTLAYAAGLALLFISPRWKAVVGVLAPMGRMALTCYLLQTVLGVWLCYGFAGGPALMGRTGAATMAGVAAVGFGVQIVLARAWLRCFRFGPAEWLWRTLTYARFQPLRITAGAPEARA